MVWLGNWYHYNDSPSALTQTLRLSIFDGRLGVSLFFVISGLCIRLSHLGSKNFSVLHFYWRRFCRIYPPYLLAMSLFIIWQRYTDIGSILAHLFLVHNFSNAYFGAINGPFWSLALEWQVYLLYPILLFFHQRLGVGWTCLLLCCLSAIPEFLGGQTFRHFFHLPDSFSVLNKTVFSLWFTWYMGFLLAENLVSRKSPGMNSRLLLMVALLLFPLVKPLSANGRTSLAG